MTQDRRRNDRREEDRKRAAELLGSGLISELAGDVRRLTDAVIRLRDEVRRRAARQHAQRIRVIVGLLVAIIVASQVSALRIDWCLLDVHFVERPTAACDVLFPTVTHGNLRALPAWPTVWNVVGLIGYGVLTAAGWSAIRRAGRLTSEDDTPPDEELP